MAFIEKWQLALGNYHERQWETALAQFITLAARAGGDVASDLYVERCKAYLENPPSEDWDGVTIMTTK
jgi:adenylate cyclase